MAEPAATGLVKVKVEQRLNQLGGPVEIKPVANSATLSKPAPATPPSNASAGRDREIALWVLSLGGKADIVTGSEPHAHGCR